MSSVEKHDTECTNLAVAQGSQLGTAVSPEALETCFLNKWQILERPLKDLGHHPIAHLNWFIKWRPIHKVVIEVRVSGARLGINVTN